MHLYEHRRANGNLVSNTPIRDIWDTLVNYFRSLDPDNWLRDAGFEFIGGQWVDPVTGETLEEYGNRFKGMDPFNC